MDPQRRAAGRAGRGAGSRRRCVPPAGSETPWGGGCGDPPSRGRRGLRLPPRRANRGAAAPGRRGGGGTGGTGGGSSGGGGGNAGTHGAAPGSADARGAAAGGSAEPRTGEATVPQGRGRGASDGRGRGGVAPPETERARESLVTNPGAGTPAPARRCVGRRIRAGRLELPSYPAGGRQDAAAGREPATAG